MMPFIADRDSFMAGKNDKQAIIEYINNVASNAELRDMRFNLTYKHGSSASSQLALVSMLNHMKLIYRLMIAKMVLNLWEIAAANGGIQTDETMPDVEKVRSATVKSHNALQQGKNSYSDI